MTIDEILDLIDETLEDTMAVPLSKKRMVDIDLMHEYIDDIRLNMPAEIRQARAIVNDRKDIVEVAKKEAEDIIRAAEKKAVELVNREQVVKDASTRAAEILHTANVKARDMKNSTENYCDKILKDLEEQMAKSSAELRTIRVTLRKGK